MKHLKALSTAPGVKDKVLCSWTYLWNSPFYLLRFSRTLTGFLRGMKKTAAQLPNYHRFFNISHLVSLQMQKRRHNLAERPGGRQISCCPALWQLQQQAWVWEVGEGTSRVGAHSKAVIKLIPTIKSSSLKDDVILGPTKRPTSM